MISTSFADIFYNNCFQNGLLPIVLPAEQVRALMAEAKGGNHVFEVDLESQTVAAPSGAALHLRHRSGPQGKDAQGPRRDRRDPAGTPPAIDDYETAPGAWRAPGWRAVMMLVIAGTVRAPPENLPSCARTCWSC